MDKGKQLLQKYLAGKTTPEETRQVERWYYAFDESDDRQTAEEAILERVKTNLLTKTTQTYRLRFLRPPLARAAAMLLLIGSAALFGIRFFYKQHIVKVTYNAYHTANGERKTISLPDGSVVTLNAASTLKVPSDFGSHNRSLELTGEAFFEVVHNAQKPFLVKTGSLLTKDIGTAFNIQAYPSDTHVQVTVSSGLVGISAGKKILAARLSPNQLLDYDTRDQSHNIKAVNAAHVTAWKQNELYIDALSIPEIARILERKYNIPIRVTGAAKATCLYTVKFSHENLGQALDILAGLSGAQWEMQPRQIIINAKTCK